MVFKVWNNKKAIPWKGRKSS